MGIFCCKVTCGREGCSNTPLQGRLYCAYCFYTFYKCKKCDFERMPEKDYCYTHCWFLCNEKTCSASITDVAFNVMIGHAIDDDVLERAENRAQQDQERLYRNETIRKMAEIQRMELESIPPCDIPQKLSPEMFCK